MGFVRHLTAGEIVGQVMHVLRHELSDSDTLRNVVFMGMGEPLHNLTATMDAIEILTDDRGLGIGPTRITVSTIGLPDAIQQFARSNLPINLAVSLHGISDEERGQLVPVNRRWKIADLLEACARYIEKSKRRIFFEWALIDGVNDTQLHARALGELLSGLDAHVNLIPLNPTIEFDGAPSDKETILEFQQTLSNLGIPNTVRRKKGVDIDAGCGQLTSRAIASRLK